MCGDAALKSLLNHWYQKAVFFDVIDVVPPQATLAQMQRFARMYGLSIKAFKVDHLNKTKAINHPFIVLTKSQTTTHYMLVQWHDAQRLKTAHQGETLIVDAETLQQSFTGYLLHSEGFQKFSLPKKAFIQWNVKSLHGIQWMQLLTLSIVTVSMVVMSLGLPVDGFIWIVAMLIMQYIFHQVQWLLGLHQFDHQLMKRYAHWIHDAKQYERFQHLKIALLKPVLLLTQSMFYGYLLWLYGWLIDDRLGWLCLLLALPYGWIKVLVNEWTQNKEKQLEHLETSFFNGSIVIENFHHFQSKTLAYMFKIQGMFLVKMILISSIAFLFLWLTTGLSIYSLSILISLLWFWTNNIDQGLSHFSLKKKAKHLIYEFIIHRKT